MGVYSTLQFLGIALGGTLGGLIQNSFTTNDVLLLSAVLAATWFVIITTLEQVTYSSTLIFTWKRPETAEKLQQTLTAMAGVQDVALAADEHLIYIKADKKIIDENKL